MSVRSSQVLLLLTVAVLVLAPVVAAGPLDDRPKTGQPTCEWYVIGVDVDLNKIPPVWPNVQIRPECL